jgi:TATA-box binding protein (TBP) (component of TFIID and TFIIIB)
MPKHPPPTSTRREALGVKNAAKQIQKQVRAEKTKQANRAKRGIQPYRKMQVRNFVTNCSIVNPLNRHAVSLEFNSRFHPVSFATTLTKCLSPFATISSFEPKRAKGESKIANHSKIVIVGPNNTMDSLLTMHQFVRALNVRFKSNQWSVVNYKIQNKVCSARTGTALDVELLADDFLLLANLPTEFLGLTINFKKDLGVSFVVFRSGCINIVGFRPFCSEESIQNRIDEIRDKYNADKPYRVLDPSKRRRFVHATIQT